LRAELIEPPIVVPGRGVGEGFCPSD
jgi:hypothetical protein